MSKKKDRNRSIVVSSGSLDCPVFVMVTTGATLDAKQQSGITTRAETFARDVARFLDEPDKPPVPGLGSARSGSA